MKIVFAGRHRTDERLQPIKELGRQLPLPESGPEERALLDAIERAAGMDEILITQLFRRMKRRWTGRKLESLTQIEMDEIAAVLREARK